MFDLAQDEVEAVSGANAQDTVTGSFVGPQTFGQCLTAGALDQWKSGLSSLSIFVTCLLDTK